MIEFRKRLEDELLEKMEDWVGEDTDPLDHVKTFDSHLHDFDLTDTPEPWPFLVVNVRNSEKAGESNEIGQKHDLRVWTVHIYYIDVTPTYDMGEDRRDKLLGIIERELENDHRLGNFEYTDGTGVREYVYDLDIPNVLFDSSGQEEYYSFVSELYLNIYTAKT